MAFVDEEQMKNYHADLTLPQGPHQEYMYANFED